MIACRNAPQGRGVCGIRIEVQGQRVEASIEAYRPSPWCFVPPEVLSAVPHDPRNAVLTADGTPSCAWEWPGTRVPDTRRRSASRISALGDSERGGDPQGHSPSAAPREL